MDLAYTHYFTFIDIVCTKLWWIPKRSLKWQFKGNFIFSTPILHDIPSRNSQFLWNAVVFTTFTIYLIYLLLVCRLCLMHCMFPCIELEHMHGEECWVWGISINLCKCIIKQTCMFARKLDIVGDSWKIWGLPVCTTEHTHTVQVCANANFIKTTSLHCTFNEASEILHIYMHL